MPCLCKSHATFPSSLVGGFPEKFFWKALQKQFMENWQNCQKQQRIPYKSLLLKHCPFFQCSLVILKMWVTVDKTRAGSGKGSRPMSLFKTLKVRNVLRAQNKRGVSLEQSQTINCSTLFCQDWSNPKLCIAGTEGELPGRKSPEKSTGLFHWRILPFELAH